MKKTVSACLALCLCAGMSVTAQETLKVKFRSRALLDTSVSGYGKESTQGYYRVEDFRVGFKATYGQYEVKADVGLGGGKGSNKGFAAELSLGKSHRLLR